MISVVEYVEPVKLGSKIRENLKNKTNSLQFLPDCLNSISKQKTLEFKGKKIKTTYLIDITHNLLLKYYFKKENKFNLSSIVLKDKYGHQYNYYIEYLILYGIIKMVKNYKSGKNARIYKLNDSVIEGKITRYKNYDKVLLKKYKNIASEIDNKDIVKNTILPSIKQKLVDDLFHIQIDYEKSIFFLDSTMQDADIYNKNKYSVDAIKTNHIFYHFDSYGRLHTNFTILKSFIRKNCLLIDSEETCEVDISNSQPLFLCKIIHSNIDGVNIDEFNLFKYLAINGKLYQYFMDNSKILDRKEVKQMVYKVLFGKNFNSKSDDIFKDLFPSIYKFIKDFKKKLGNHKILSHHLQKLESNLIFNKIIKSINELYPEIRVITVHDSIIFSKKYKDIIEIIFNQKVDEEFNTLR